ncbi:MAG: HAMP domain-containing methyl-accepting chemotaxis protein [Clostridiales bacterium]|nr:HAMP domain-containing methyl-accepting chemotaxis protein [Clostridiales bacterium]
MDKKNSGKMSVQKRITSGYNLVITLLVVMAVISLIIAGYLDLSFKNFNNGVNKADEAVKTTRIQVNTAARFIREMVLDDDKSNYASYRSRVDESFAEIAVENRNLEEAGVIDLATIQEYESLVLAWEDAAYEIMDTIEAGKREEAVNRILTECSPTLQKVVDYSIQLDNQTNMLVQEAINSNNILFGVSAVVIVALAVAAVAVAKTMGIKIAKSITVPLQEVEAAARELTVGNLKVQIQHDSEDEVGSLARSLREAIQILNSYVVDLSRAMEEFAAGNFTVQPEVEWRGDFVALRDSFVSFEQNMVTTIQGLREIANQVGSGAEQVSDSSTELAQGATEQASATEELAATVETVSQQVMQNVDDANAIRNKVAQNGEEILSGNAKMREMMAAMAEISESSEKIHRIIDAINDIATQTNLLSLNASIEAARAGEAGKGFAVVANQVSVLAAQSSDAARESTVLIESSVQAVERGMMIAKETAEQLENVVEDSRVIEQEVGKIVDTMRTQADSIRQINDAVDQINDVVQTNSATSQECAANSHEMSNQASTLEDLISAFRV